MWWRKKPHHPGRRVGRGDCPRVEVGGEELRADEEPRGREVSGWQRVGTRGVGERGEHASGDDNCRPAPRAAPEEVCPGD